MTTEEMNRYRGCLLGLATGDALGTTLEFKRPGSFRPIDDMVGGGPFRLAPGMWTDDTSMALCLAESLIERQGVRPGGPDAPIRALVRGRASILKWLLLRYRNYYQGISYALHRNGGSVRWLHLPFLSRKRLPDATRAGADVLRSVYGRRCGP